VTEETPKTSVKPHKRMQLSSSFPISPPKIFPSTKHHKPPVITHQLAAQIQSNRRHFVSPVKVSGYFSSISRAIEEEEEYRKARAAVNRKGVELESYAIEGISVGGHETCVIVPELKCVFDIGRCPSRAIQQKFLFITHAHLDHIVSCSKFESFFKTLFRFRLKFRPFD